MMKKFKLSNKHFEIFEKIRKNGFYKPAYSDQEPATTTLIKQNIVEWRDDWRGVKLTDFGKEFVDEYNKLKNDKQ